MATWKKAEHFRVSREGDEAGAKAGTLGNRRSSGGPRFSSNNLISEQRNSICSDFAEIENAAALVEHEKIPTRDFPADSKVNRPGRASFFFQHSRLAAPRPKKGQAISGGAFEGYRLLNAPLPWSRFASERPVHDY